MTDYKEILDLLYMAQDYVGDDTEVNNALNNAIAVVEEKM